MLKLTSLTDIITIDYLYEYKNRFEIIHIFWNHLKNIRIFLRININIFSPILSIYSFYNSANWLEREIFDMFGIKFLIHSDLRRILTDYGFNGYPLRKDFPTTGFIEIFYDDMFQSISIYPIEESQLYRIFRFENPWNYWV
jgi:NADH-quinone oxidoreductase subunit C